MEKQSNPRLITNTKEQSFYKELRDSIRSCNAFYFSVAFISFSGLQLLLDEFRAIQNTKVRGKIITSTYLHFTDVKSLKRLLGFPFIETKIFIAKEHEGFHTKAYIFEYDDYYKFIVGSSNITQSALMSNIEWNIQYIAKHDDSFSSYILREYERLWLLANEINDEFFSQYQSFFKEVRQLVLKEKEIVSEHIEIKPNNMQQRALENLAHLRHKGESKGLIVAATGTGKTYLSAFDIKQMKPKRVLFVVHRKKILKAALKSYQQILHFEDDDATIFQGQNKQYQVLYTFAMIRTISKPDNLHRFSKNAFDYIVVDEAHRSFSDSYRRIMSYFEPRFMLGMTATPERTDGGNVFALYHNNIALEMRLKDALEDDLVVPFHYFGIADIQTDYSRLDLDHIDALANALKIRDRVDFVIENMEFYGYDGEKRKGLGFCVTKDHARFMADEFQAFGYPSAILTGESSERERDRVVEQLENVNHPLEFIFTVDIFNEGIDIPSVNLVLMLRPTQSPIVFTQQLGRGLRKHIDKDFLTVLDFIGNHKKSFLIPVALSGTRYYDKDMLKVQVESEFDDIPGCSSIRFDEISKEYIFQQLERTSFNKLSFLEEEYREFKRFLGGRTPELTDFLAYESSPDPIKFINKKGSYVQFISSIEPSPQVPKLTQEQLRVLQIIDKMLPVKRVQEFFILRELFKGKLVHVGEIYAYINREFSHIDKSSIKHSFAFLSEAFFSSNRMGDFWFIASSDDMQSLQLHQKIRHMLEEKPLYLTLIQQSIEYGIARYKEEFGLKSPDYPYLKLNYKYKMRDLGLLTNYNKSFSSIRGSGLWHFKNHYYLIVTLHKDESIRDSIRYKDKIISKNEIQWQTPNNTGQKTVEGRKLIEHQERGITLHLLIRKAKKMGNEYMRFYYLGPVNLTNYYGEKPITMLFEMVHPINDFIFKDLTKRV